MFGRPTFEAAWFRKILDQILEIEVKQATDSPEETFLMVDGWKGSCHYEI